MNPEIINLSNAIAIATGDTLQDAFDKVNINFTTQFSAINFAAANTALVLSENASTFNSSLEVNGGLTVDQDVVLLANVSAMVDGGSF